MPKASERKIKSALKLPSLHTILVVGLILVVLAVMAQYIQAASRQEGPAAKVHNKVFKLDIADTEAARERGLSGRQGIAYDQAMLFIFDDVASHCFWMKDMRFNIDMIWLNSNRQVVHIERNVSPSTYPNAFCPREASKYVLEIQANATYKYDIAKNDVFSINLQ